MDEHEGIAVIERSLLGLALTRIEEDCGRQIADPVSRLRLSARTLCAR